MSEIIGEGQIQNILTKELQGGAEGAPVSAEHALLAEAERDITGAAELSASVQDDGIRLPAMARDDGEPESQDEVRDRRNKMMQRAAKQRKQGEQGLMRKEAGVSMLNTAIEIKARPLSAVFVRWFSAIDMCAGNLQRYGEMVLGQRKCQTLIESLTSMIEKVYEQAEGELARMQQLVDKGESQAKPGEFVRPTIITPALRMEGVTIGTKLGFKVYKAIKLYDEALDLVNPLVWNDLMTQDQQGVQELQYKREFGNLYRFAARVNINTHNLLKKGRGRKAGKADAPQAEAGHANVERNDAVHADEGVGEHAVNEAAVA